MSNTPNNGDDGLIYKTRNKDVIIEASDTPVAGDELLITPTDDGKYVTHGTSPTPHVGDEGIIAQTKNGPIYIAGGMQECDPNNIGAWNWYPAGIDATPWVGKHIKQLDIIWSSKQFRAIKFDIYFIGYCKIWAFGQVVLDMPSPTDENGWAVEYHLQQTYYSDNPCGSRACRLQLTIGGIMTFATLRGNVEVHLGREGSVNPSSEVITV